MAGWREACLIAAFVAGFGATDSGTLARADDRASTRQGLVCGGDEIARGTVGKILDGRTFVLDDGREVRLAAIEVALPGGPQDRADGAGHAAAAALGALAAGDQVVLRRAENGSDRYGRLLAYAYTLRDSDEFLLQRELVAEGFARVSTRIASPCAGHLLDREKAAREAKLGLWADPYYEVAQCRDAEGRPGLSRPICADRGQSSVRARKRADNLREFRPAADWGHYGYDPETKRAQFRGGGS